MHFVRIDRDDVAGLSLHHAAAAKRRLRPSGHQADAELLVRMARKAVMRLRLHRFDA